MRTDRHVTRFAILLLVSLCASQARAAQPTGLHLTDEVTISIGSQPGSTDHRDLYILGARLSMRSQGGWLIIDTTNKLIWMLDPQRRFISSFSLDQTTPRSKGATPALHPTGETQAVAGMTCQMFTAQQQTNTVTACLARLPELEQFQTIFKTPPGTKGVPLILTINGTAPGGPISYTQRILRIDRTAVDPAVFALPKLSR
jgi:hypothetical protein